MGLQIYSQDIYYYYNYFCLKTNKSPPTYVSNYRSYMCFGFRSSYRPQTKKKNYAGRPGGRAAFGKNANLSTYLEQKRDVPLHFSFDKKKMIHLHS